MINEYNSYLLVINYIINILKRAFSMGHILLVHNTLLKVNGEMYTATYYFLAKINGIDESQRVKQNNNAVLPTPSFLSSCRISSYQRIIFTPLIMPYKAYY